MYAYKKTSVQHIKFQRIIMGWLAIASLYFFNIQLVYAFFAITALGIITGSAFSVPTLFYKFVHRLFKVDLVTVSDHHVHYYEINTTMDFIDHLLRLVASAIVIVLYYYKLEYFAWLVVCFLSIFMMLSAYFGFCLSALTYVLLQNIKYKFLALASNNESQCKQDHQLGIGGINLNCVLAKRCFTPYKRCEHCHINITECLGTKFNVLMLIVGTLTAMFLFVDNFVFERVNVIVIMGLLFWFGYQVNYSMDDLTDSNNANIKLNQELKSINESLEEKVKERTKEIERLATYDMLTGIFNRFSFENILTKVIDELSDDTSSHLAFIDLDKFKNVNDTAGHLAGDELLCQVSQMMSECSGEVGIVGRMGGDEFAIVFQNIDASKAHEICQQICDKTKNLNFTHNGEHFEIGASIGLVTITHTMQDLKAVVHHADEACYKAKHSGRNQVCIHEN